MRKLAFIVVAAGFLSSGCYKSKYQSTLADLKKCQESEHACAGDRERQKAEIEGLEGKIATCAKERDDAKTAKEIGDKLLADMQTNLRATRKEIDDLRRQRAETEKRLAAFKALTSRFQKMIDTGKATVVFRRGRMILKLPAGILFASGKADLSKEGQQAIAEVATILKEFPDRHFMVAGHTDNLPLRASKYRTNWDLSTTRALTVTQFLVEQGVNPMFLSAAGYGEFDPVGDNATEDGRQENRRIEIELVPNIEEMPQLDD